MPLKSNREFLKTFKHTLFLSFLMYAASWQTPYAQVRPTSAANIYKPKPLTIGDTIPEKLWNTPLQVVNDQQGKKTITLADYKGKLILLDFWSTWCSPCIRNFPKMHNLQNNFLGKIKVMAVTGENSEIINKFFKSGKGKDYTYVNSVINDTILKQYFPYISVPHVVWITPNGTLLNTTQSDPVTQENIQAVLNNQNTQMVTKFDIPQNRPLFLSKHFTDNLKLKAYSIFVKGYYPGLPSGNNFKKTKTGKVYGKQMTNTSMMNIYRSVVDHLFTENGERFNSKRIIIKVKEPVLLNVIETKDGGYEKENLYNYELIVPKRKADSLYDYMLADLNRYSDYTGTIEKHLVDCLVLVRTSTKDKIKSKGGKPKFDYSPAHSILTNHPISYLLNLINGDTLIKLPIIDETGYKENVDIELSGIKDLASLQKELGRFDLDLVPAKKNLNMFVIKDK